MPAIKTSFALDESTDAFIRDQVAKGHFLTGSDVVREALRRMKASAEKEATILRRLDQALAETSLETAHDELWDEALKP
jgi:putative addiction module CopG family antidote